MFVRVSIHRTSREEVDMNSVIRMLRRTRRPSAVVLAAAVGLGTVTTLAGPATASDHGRHGGHHHSTPEFSPVVKHTGKAPTGYEVTFRYRDPTADTVQLRGEWFFSGPSDTTTTSSAGRLPTQWQVGDFPIAHPNNGPAANWPVVQMTLNQATGVWSYTTPLPSGTFTYGFYVNCTAPPPSLSGCTELSDPSNPPWNTTGSVEPTSQVYVPPDPRFGTEDLSWQAPDAKKQGKLENVSYPSPESTDPVGSHPLAVYLPPGYNPHRRLAYPTLYLSHGGGGNEVDWSTQGAANSIMDNLVADRSVQPMVVIMTNFNNLGCSAFQSTCYAADLKDNVIPFVEQNYHVSTDPADRAFGGLSLGGLRANYLLFNDTRLFGYLASWSIGAIGAPDPSDPLWANPDLRTRLGLVIGGGVFDSLTIPGIDTYEGWLDDADIAYTDARVDGGHEWYVWRKLLRDYATGVAFRHTTTTVTVTPHGPDHGRTHLKATVVADTTEPAHVRGTVAFYVDGSKVGSGRVSARGKARETIRRGLLHPGSTVTATYSGDRFYDGSTGTVST